MNRHVFVMILYFITRGSFFFADLSLVDYWRKISVLFAPNVAGEKMQITFFPDRGLRQYKSQLVLQGSTSVIYLYKAVQVCYIPIPGDI